MRFHKPSFPVDLILSMASSGVSKFQSHSFDLRINDNVKFFAKKGVVCDVCGVKGKHFRVGKVKKHAPYLVLENENGTIMTFDHSTPKCAGGSNHTDNGVPLCNHCNGVWKSKFDAKISDKNNGIIPLKFTDMVTE